MSLHDFSRCAGVVVLAMRRVGWLAICLPAAAILSVWALAGYSSEPSAAELESMGGRRGFVPVGMRRGYASLAGERGEQGGKAGRGRSIRRLHRDTDEGLVESSGGGGKGGGGGGGSGGGGCGAGGWGSHPISCLRHAIGSTSETSKRHRRIRLAAAPRGADGGIAEERSKVDEMVGQGMESGQLHVPRTGPLRRWLDTAKRRARAAMEAHSLLERARGEALEARDAITPLRNSTKAAGGRARGKGGGMKEERRGGEEREERQGREDEEEYEAGRRDAREYARGVKAAQSIMRQTKGKTGASSFLIVPVGGGRKSAATFLPSLVDIADNERKKAADVETVLEKQRRMERELEIERRRAEERRELRETAAAQKRIIRELRGDLRAGERLATSRQAPLHNTPLRRQRLAASPPAGALAGGLESAAVRVTPPQFNDPTIRALEERTEKEVFRQAAARMERRKLQGALERVRNDELKIARENADIAASPSAGGYR